MGFYCFWFYGVGHCSVIVFAGTFTEVVQRYMNWNEKSKGASYLKKNLRRAGTPRRSVADLRRTLILITARNRNESDNKH